MAIDTGLPAQYNARKTRFALQFSADMRVRESGCTMDDIQTLIDAALALETEGKEQVAIDAFAALLERYPDHPLVVFEMAGAYDFAGRESEALPYYQRARALGLPDELMKYLYVQMGSTQRNLGLHAESLATLREGIARFPEYRPLRAFLALALFSAGQAGDALAEMIDLTVDAPDFYPQYRRALREYAAELRGKG